VSDEPVDDPRESSDSLLLALRRAGSVPIFAKFRAKRFKFHFSFTLHFFAMFLLDFYSSAAFSSWAVSGDYLACSLPSAASIFSDCPTHLACHLLAFHFNQCEIDSFIRPVSIALGTFSYVSL
jgi:hypothetical protein